MEDEGLAGLLGHADEALLEVAHLLRDLLARLREGGHVLHLLGVQGRVQVRVQVRVRVRV